MICLGGGLCSPSASNSCRVRRRILGFCEWANQRGLRSDSTERPSSMPRGGIKFSMRVSNTLLASQRILGAISARWKVYLYFVFRYCCYSGYCRWSSLFSVSVNRFINFQFRSIRSNPSYIRWKWPLPSGVVFLSRFGL